MAGQIKKLLDKIVEERAHGDTVLINTTRTKIILKGINVDSYTSSSEDDPGIIAKVQEIAKEFNITL